MSLSEKAEDVMRKARARAAFLRPYFTSALFALVLIESEVVPTTAVDKYRRVYYNPSWVTHYSIDDMTTVMLHELGHVLRDHHERARAIGVTNRTWQYANVSMDAALNDDLKEEADAGEIAQLPDPIDPKVMALPEHMRGPFYPSKLGCEDGLPWEAYYRHMLQNEDDFVTDGTPMFAAMDCGSGAHGASRPWELGDPSQSGVEGVLDADWKDVQEIVAREIMKHTERGLVPGGWVEWADRILKPPPIRWEDTLTSHLRWAFNDVAGMVYHTYKRPSRRQSAYPDFVMPHMRRPVPFVCLIGDTSGSMHETRLAYLRGVVRDICHSLGARLAFLATDADVHGGVQIAHDGRDIELRGRGGTNMAVGIEYAMRFVHPKPDVLVVATDCETAWPATPPAIKTVVCAIGASDYYISQIPSWATVVKVPLQEQAA